jgi:hypothetical protein
MPRSILCLVTAVFTAGYLSHAVIYPLATKIIEGHDRVDGRRISMNDAITGKTKFCATVVKGHWVSWKVRDDGMCYSSDAPQKD